MDTSTQYPGGMGIFITTILLAGILMTGPMILGAARLWIELPLLAAVSLLLVVQGLRLATRVSEGAKFQLDAIDLGVVLFALYAIVRWLTSSSAYFSRIEAMDVVAYAGIFLTCRHGMVNRQLCMFLLYLLVLLGVGETAFGYYLSNHLDWFPFGPAERLHDYYAPRWLGTYGCPNHYGYLLVMAMGAAMALGSFSKLPWPVRIILFYVSIMMMVGVMYSGSRGSWIALAASICALVIIGIRNGAMRWWVPVTGALMLTIVSVFLFSLSPVVRMRLADGVNLLSGDKLQTYVRVELARDALHIAHDNPLFGTGPGTFVFIHPRYQDSTFAFKAVLTHDDYLNCLDDYGIIGFGLAMFFVAAVTLKFFRPLEIDSRWQDRVLVATGFAAWIALLFHSLVDFNLHIPANAMLFFALTGLAVGRIKKEGDNARHWSTLSLTPLGRWLGWGVVVLSLLYGAEATRSAISDIIYEEASAHDENGTQADIAPTSQLIASTNQALAYDPDNAQALMYLGDLYRYQASRQSDIEGRISEGQKALNAYQKALRANSIDDTLLARMGMTYDVMRSYSEAFFCYQQAVTHQPYNGQFWYRLGNHYWERGMLPKAEMAYLQSLSCPHGGEGSAGAEQQLRDQPEMYGVPPPAPGANPLAAPSESDERPTLP